MTTRTRSLSALAALAITIAVPYATLAITDSLNHQLALMACRRTPDTLCARS
jgi:hypothetical protein